jgi:predicted membrane chloride channel (bestrophin family)
MSKIGDPAIDQETLKGLAIASTAVEAFSKKLADQKTIYNLNMDSLVTIQEGLEHLSEMIAQCKRRVIKPIYTRFRQSQGGQKAAIQAKQSKEDNVDK